MIAAPLILGRLLGDLVVTSEEIQKGDCCVGVVRDGVNLYFSGHHEVVANADSIALVLEAIYAERSVSRRQLRIHTCPQVIIRARVAQRDPNFPGKCTRCGRTAYVSALAVAHRDEDAAKDCPARRA